MGISSKFEKCFAIHINPWNNLQKHFHKYTDFRLAVNFISSLYSTIAGP